MTRTIATTTSNSINENPPSLRLIFGDSRAYARPCMLHVTAHLLAHASRLLLIAC
jgi:hypothetical protein